jgi:deoxyribonuclease V
MYACVDVDYRPTAAVAACLLFADFADADAARTLIATLPAAAPYEPGQFYRRELPCLLQILQLVSEPLQAVVIDGYVWLGEHGAPGLGARLHEAIGVPVIGVAKTAFLGSAQAVAVYRGGSAKPLHVSAVGIPAAAAAQAVQRMHGPHRLPTLLKLVDRLCRDAPLDRAP